MLWITRHWSMNSRLLTTKTQLLHCRIDAKKINSTHASLAWHNFSIEIKCQCSAQSRWMSGYRINCFPYFHEFLRWEVFCLFVKMCCQSSFCPFAIAFDHSGHGWAVAYPAWLWKHIKLIVNVKAACKHGEFVLKRHLGLLEGLSGSS